MQVQNIRTNQNSRPNFTHWLREVKNPVTNAISHRNDTCFFRDETFISTLANKLALKYQDAPKVNIYCYGCSNGSEPHSLYMALDSRYPKGFTKKFNFIAKDFDPVAIKEAELNEYYITPDEKARINQNTYNRFDTYFERKQKLVDFKNFSSAEYRTIIAKYCSNMNHDQNLYSLKPEHKQAVSFEVANILDDYKNIDPENCVVMARNFWAYLKDGQQQELATKLYNQLDKSSTFVIGGVDFAYTPIIEKAGFKTDPIRLIWEK